VEVLGVKRWQIVGIVFLAMLSGLITPCVSRAERARPIRIGALSESWGPTPGMVGLRDGLLKLGYREDEDFFLGVRFTQGNLAELPAAARELVQHGVDLLFTAGECDKGSPGGNPEHPDCLYRCRRSG
jgi:hypothetical protein